MSPTLHVSDPGTRWTVPDPRELALRIRLRAVRMVAPQGFGYLGQALSSAEQVAAAFACARPGVDRLVCSPGHYIIGPFAAAAELGLLDDEALSSYGQNGSPFEAIGPVYLRLKRGEIPVIFDDEHALRLGQADVLVPGTDAALFASGMMLAAALAAASALGEHGVSVSVINVPVIKPLDTATVRAAAAGASIVVTAENHSVIGGLGSAVAETIAEAGLGRPLRRIGIRDTFAEGSRDAPYLFEKYGLSTRTLIETIWSALDRPGPAPAAPHVAAQTGEYSPV